MSSKKEARSKSPGVRKRSKSKTGKKSRSFSISEQQQKEPEVTFQDSENNEDQQEQQQQNTEEKLSSILKNSDKNNREVWKLTNKEKLEKNYPQLLAEQGQILHAPLDFRRSKYHSKTYKPVSDLESWSQNGAELSSLHRLSDLSPAAKRRGKPQQKKKVSKSPAKTKQKKSRAESDEEDDENALPTNMSIDDRLNSKICVTQDDMLELEADCTAVTLTDGTGSGGGLAKAIFNAAGSNMKEEMLSINIASILNSSSANASGFTVTTCGYDLPYRYVVHTRVLGYEKKKILEHVYSNIFKAAHSFGCKTIVLPCLGTGAIGVSPNKGGSSQCAAIRKFLESDEGKQIERIVISCKKDKDYAAVVRHMQAYFPLDGKPKPQQVNLENLIRCEDQTYSFKSICTSSKMNFGHVSTLEFGDSTDICVDATFYALYLDKDSSLCNSVDTLDLTGCIYLSDTGLQLAISMFQLKKLTLDCCTQITERSIDSALDKGGLTKLEHFSAKHCSISALSDKTYDFVQNCGEDCLVGCPAHELRSCKEWSSQQSYRIVIVRNSSAGSSIISQLEGNKQPFNGVFHYAKLKAGNETLNMFECSADVAQDFVDFRTIICLPETCSTASMKKLLTCFVNASGIVIENHDNFKNLQSIIKSKNLELAELMIKKLSNQSKHSWSDVRALSLLTVDFSFAEKIHEGKEKIEQSNVLDWWKAVKSFMPKRKLPSSMLNPYLKSDVPFCEVNSSSSLKCAVDFLCQTGDLFRVPGSDLYLKSIAQLVEILNKCSISQSNVDGVDRLVVPWLSKEQHGVFNIVPFKLLLIEAWQDKIDISQVHKFTEAFTRNGLFIFVSEPWMNDISPQPAIICTDLLPHEPNRMVLNQLWPESRRNFEGEHFMYFEIPVATGHIALRMVLSELCSFVQPVYAWNIGVIAQFGNADIRLSVEDEGNHRLCLGVRTLRFPQGSGNSRGDSDPYHIWDDEACERLKENLMEIFKLFRLAIEATLIKNNIGYTTSVRCVHCRVKERMHEFDVAKVIQDENETSIKCPTFNTTIGIWELGIDTFFSTGCKHISFLINSTVDSSLACTLCGMNNRLVPSSVTCNQCSMCLRCIKQVQLWQATVDLTGCAESQSSPSTNDNTEAASRLKKHGQSQYGMNCAHCKKRFRNRRSVKTHESKWCSKNPDTWSRIKSAATRQVQQQQNSKISKNHTNISNQENNMNLNIMPEPGDTSAQFERRSNIFAMKNVPFVLKCSLKAPEASKITIKPVKNADEIYIRLKAGSTTGEYMCLRDILKKCDLSSVEVAIEWHYDSAQVIIANADWRLTPKYRVSTQRPLGEVNILFAAFGATAAVSATNNLDYTPDVSVLSIGQFFEAPKQNGSKMFAGARIAGFNEHGHVEFSCGQNSLERQCLPITDLRLHPVGFSQHTQQQFQPPIENTNAGSKIEVFDWKQYLMANEYDAVSQDFFTTEQIKETPKVRLLFGGIRVPPASLGWQIGMRLEAVDRKNPNLICVASVQAVNKQEGKVTIKLDGWTNKYEYQSETSTPDFHPIGYCKHLGLSLQAPKEYEKKFAWHSYLTEINAVPVPYELFGRRQTGNCPKHSIYDGGNDENENEAEDLEDAQATDQNSVNISLRARNFMLNWLHETPAVKIVMLPSHLQDALKEHPFGDRSFAENWSHADFYNLTILASDQNTYRLPQSLLYMLQSSAVTNSKALGQHEIYKGPFDSSLISRAHTPVQFSSAVKLVNGENCGDLCKLLVRGGSSDKRGPSKARKKSTADNTRSSPSESDKSMGCQRLIMELRLLLLEGHRSIMHNRINAQPESITKLLFNQSGLDLITLERLFRFSLSVGHALSVLCLNYARCPQCAKDACHGKCSNNNDNNKNDDDSEINGENTDEPNNIKVNKEEELSRDRANIAKDWLLPPVEAKKLQKQRAGMTQMDSNGTEFVPTIRVLPLGEWNGASPVEATDWSVSSHLNTVLGSRELDVVNNSVNLPQSMIKDYDLENFEEVVNAPLACDLKTLSAFPFLKVLFLENCALTKFESFNPNWCHSLELLNLSGNPLQKFPLIIRNFMNLRKLQLARCGISDVPSEVTSLLKLELLDLSMNLISKDKSIEVLKNLPELRQFELIAPEQYPPIDSTGEFSAVTVKHMRLHLLMYHTSMENARKHIPDVFGVSQDGSRLIDESKQLAEYNSLMCSQVLPRLGQWPAQISMLPNLRILKLDNQNFQSVDSDLADCCQLEQLTLSNCLNLEKLDHRLGLLDFLFNINLQNCPRLQTPPLSVVKRGTEGVIAYLRRLLSGFQECRRTKLMFVGLGGAGKTSLLHSLLNGSHKTSESDRIEITDGIDIADWTVKVPVSDSHDVTINYSMWDFAGQSVYYNTHQFFLSDRAVYLLLWNARLGYEHGGLEFWLSSIACHAPKAPIFVVGTHADQVYRSDLPKQELQRTFKQICGFFAVSTKTGQGVRELTDKLLKVTLQQSYMNAKVPKPFLSLEKDLLAKRKHQDLIEMSDIQNMGVAHGFLDIHEIRPALVFLHELGSIQYFQSELLRDRIVINPQWLVDVMACLITVKESVIVEGRFKKEDIELIWKTYRKDLHEWLLRLTEEFDLAYFVPTDNVYVVPCLLPEQEPEFDWPEIADDSNNREMKLVYKFDYLPSGLFNRCQSRLCEYSDSSTVWKKGSMLHKNNHLALIRQSHDKEIVLRVQGPRPENILFLVHDVVEGLIRDFFHGVKYDLSIPCVECVRAKSQNPHMFAASQVRRAHDLNAPVLQCSQSFHIVAIAALQELLPPSSTSDFTRHLTGMMHDLNSLKRSLTIDVLIICHYSDAEGGSSKKNLTAKRLEADLRKSDLRVEICGFGGSSKRHAQLMTDLTIKLSSSAVAMVLVTDHLCSEKKSSSVISYIKQNTANHFLPVINVSSSEWRKGTIGLLVSSEIYIEVNENSKYDSKLPEIFHRCQDAINHAKGQLKNTQSENKETDVFISYCWANSKEAVSQGTSNISGAVTDCDPRRIDELLRKEGIDVWLDIRNMRQGALFEEICEGLRSARLVLAFVSDEYLKSLNCKNEFRFSAGVLKKPIILCPVGEGQKWQTSEIALLSIGALRVNPENWNDLLKAVQHLLDKSKAKDELQELNTEKKEASDPKNHKNSEKTENYDAYAEMCELAQRNFSQQVTKSSAAMKSKNNAIMQTPHPRLIFLDVRKELVGDEKNTRIEPTADTNERRESRPGSHKSVAKSSKRVIHKSTVGSAIDSLQLSDFVVRYLCEMDGSWHIVGKPIPLISSGENAPKSVNDLLQESSAYLAGILSVLQHSAISVNLFRITKWPAALLLELKRLAQSSSFDISYKYVWDLSRASDQTRQRTELHRCALHSRRIVWLCDQHAQESRGAIADDVLETEEVGLRLGPASPDSSIDSGFQSLAKSAEGDSPLSSHDRKISTITLPSSIDESRSSSKQEKRRKSKLCLIS